MKESDMEKIAEYIDKALKSKLEKELNLIKEDVKEWTKDFPIPVIDKL